MGQQDTLDTNHAPEPSDRASALRWAIIFSICWLIGWIVFSYVTGETFRIAIETALPYSVLLGILAYVL
ncbi:hypothetical protein GCM10009000_034010 [Halobacterium noricense]